MVGNPAIVLSVLPKDGLIVHRIFPVRMKYGRCNHKQDDAKGQ
jgi:hypothetical protein